MRDFLLKTSAQILGQAIGLGLALAFLIWLAHHPTLLLIAEVLTGLIVVAIVLGMIGAALYGVWQLLTWPWRAWKRRQVREQAAIASKVAWERSNLPDGIETMFGLLPRRQAPKDLDAGHLAFQAFLEKKRRSDDAVEQRATQDCEKSDPIDLDEGLEQRKAEELAKTYQDGFDSGFNFDPDEPDTESMKGGLATLLDFFNPDGEWRKRPSPEFLNEGALLMKAYRQGNRDGMAARARCQPQQLDLFQSTP